MQFEVLKSNMNGFGQHHSNGCCNPTTINFTSTTNSVTMANGSRMRGIVHSIKETGKARLLFTDDFTYLKGVLLNKCEESFSISGSLKGNIDEQVLIHKLLESLPSSSTVEPITVHRNMTINVIDNEAGQKFSIDNVDVSITVKPDNNGNAGAHFFVQIDHPAIKFSTEDVFIGNRADVEIRKFLGPSFFVRSGSRSMLSSSEERSNNSLHVGPMLVNVLTYERTAPAMRRVSVCDGCATNIIEQSNDFLV